ncbi:preprotein translocase subunit Sec61beta [Candidatus Woesearchaeota archaeon]|nr:preprotein translocase subunit Sec61beta [Candidatus Woesearchaeota archaeon]
MAKETTRMPMSTAGLTSFSEEYHSKIEIKPGHVIIVSVIVILVTAALHLWGTGLLT